MLSEPIIVHCLECSIDELFVVPLGFAEFYANTKKDHTSTCRACRVVDCAIVYRMCGVIHA